eukprot:6212066-Pleurochrysis_carterae.AAC.1
MLDEIRALIRARETDRSSGRAVTRVSDPYIGVEHHHTPTRASGSGCRLCLSLLARTWLTPLLRANP